LAVWQRGHKDGWIGLSLYEAIRRPFLALVSFFLGTAPMISHVLFPWSSRWSVRNTSLNAG